MTPIGGILFGVVIGWLVAQRLFNPVLWSQRSLRGWLVLAVYLVGVAAVPFLSGEWLVVLGVPLGGMGALLFRAALRQRRETRILNGG